MSVNTGRINPERMFERIIIWRARKAFPHLSLSALAEQLHKPKTTVRRAVKLLEVAPREMLQSFEHEAVNAWVEAVPIASAKGDHRPAKDLLLHTRAIDPVQLQGQTQIAIIFSGAEIPGLQLSPSGGDSIDVFPKQIEDSSTNVPQVCEKQQSPEPEHRQGPRGSSG
jgi:hypothetical protein